MSLRRWLVAGPLALVVALLAHFLGFGGGHAAGGAFAGLAGGLALGGVLTLAVLAVALAAKLRLTHRFTARRSAALLRRALPGSGRWTELVAPLAAGGFACYGGLEALEGHAVTAGAALAVVLASAFVALLAAAALEWLASLGVALGDVLGERASRGDAISFARRLDPATPRSSLPGAHFGRAPPARA